MRKKLKSIFLILATVIIAVAIIFTVAKAGNLEPPGSPAATMYTLSNIYTRLTTNATSTEANHNFAPGAAPTGTPYTLTQIYNAIPTIVANTVKLGTSYLGVDGSYTGTKTLPDTGQTKCYDVAGTEITCGTAPVGQDAEYTSANSPSTCNPSFTDNNDNTITDNCTGLEWKKCSQGQTNDETCSGTASTYTWENALTQCEGLDFGGHTDWRLPNIKELISIVNYQNSNPSINPTYFPATAAKYCSGTTAVDYTDYVWDVNFNNGNVSFDLKTFSVIFSVRCVRG